MRTDPEHPHPAYAQPQQIKVLTSEPVFAQTIVRCEDPQLHDGGAEASDQECAVERWLMPRSRRVR